MTAQEARQKAAAAYQCFDFCLPINPERAAVHKAAWLYWRDLARRLAA